MKINSPSRTRTYDPTVNSRLLYRLSYRGISIALTGIVYYTFLNFASTIFIFFDTYLQNHILTNDHHSEYFTTFVIQLCGHSDLIGQALDRLVSVSSMHCCTSTSDLSTSSSSRGLTLAMGYLILRGASRLDAFSVYPVQTWLPCHGLGRPTGTPAVCPSRSSRTKDSSSQISYARAG